MNKEHKREQNENEENYKFDHYMMSLHNISRTQH